MASDTNVWRGDVEDIHDHVFEDDGHLLGRDLSEDDGEGGEGMVPGGVANGESSQWQVGWVVMVYTCGQLACEAVSDKGGGCLPVGWGDVSSRVVLEDESLRS